MSPKFREILYYVGTLIPGLVGLGLVFGAIDQGAAANIGDLVAGLLGLAGAAAPATAAVKVRSQRKDGVFDPATPADAVANGVQQVIAAQAAANAEVDKVRNIVSAAVGIIPGLGPLAEQAINAIPLSVFDNR